MKRFITKPNSKIDKRIILALCVLANPTIVSYVNSSISIDWLKVVLTFIISIIIPLISYYLYFRNYSENYVQLRLSKKVSTYLSDSYIAELNRNFFDIPKACEIIDEICNATIVPIEQRKVLYDQMCMIWTECGGGSIYKVYSVPGFITEKWKRAVVEYRKYEIEND